MSRPPKREYEYYDFDADGFSLKEFGIPEPSMFDNKIELPTERAELVCALRNDSDFTVSDARLIEDVVYTFPSHHIYKEMNDPGIRARMYLTHKAIPQTEGEPLTIPAHQVVRFAYVNVTSMDEMLTQPKEALVRMPSGEERVVALNRKGMAAEGSVMLQAEQFGCPEDISAEWCRRWMARFQKIGKRNW